MPLLSTHDALVDLGVFDFAAQLSEEPLVVVGSVVTGGVGSVVAGGVGSVVTGGVGSVVTGAVAPTGLEQSGPSMLPVL